MQIPAERRELSRMRDMFHTVAPRYDLITRLFSYGMDMGWKRRAVGLANLPPAPVILDLASGTGDFFVPAGITAGSINLVGTLTASTLKASDGGAAGDNTIALAIAQLANRTFSTGGGDHIDGTFSGFFSKTVSKLGQSLSAANARVTDQANIERLVRSQRDAVSG